MRKVICCEYCGKQNYEARIAELERRVKELEAQPKETHTHFHTYPPLYVQPYAPPQPFQPTPWEPYRITWGDAPSITAWVDNVNIVAPLNIPVAPRNAGGDN